MTISQPQYNYNRRNSASAPYSIPSKHNHNQTHMPTLSRDFVVRRISEGETGRLKEELKCEACGKGYKHISSLAKHLWEHTPEWNVTKKLLISKHQQVQLLEAASILVGMNEPPLNSHSSRRGLVFLPISEDDDRRHSTTYQDIEFRQRQHSVSTHPPSSNTGEPGVPSLNEGRGYLDVSQPKGEDKEDEDDDEDEDEDEHRTDRYDRKQSVVGDGGSTPGPSPDSSELKSPLSTYSSPLAPPHAEVFSPSPILSLSLTSPKGDEIQNEE